jgi:peptidoglycan-associated lipoprotein
MKLLRMLSLSVVIVLGLFAAQCSKKVTKVTAEPPVKETPPVAEQPAPAARDSFAVVDAGDLLRAAFKTIYFDFDKADLSSEAISVLENIGGVLMAHRESRVLIEGNCDERGSAEYNIGLGQRRAQVVKNWLVTYGIADNSLEITSYGKERPAFPNCQDESCHAKNRRVEFKFLS